MTIPTDETALPFGDVPPGTLLGPISVTVSAEANRRYFEAAGVTHPALDGGALYPPIAASLTMLVFGNHCDTPVIQTHQRLICHRRAQSGTDLEVNGEVVRHYSRRGRAYIDVTVTIATASMPSEPIWTSTATYIPVTAVRS